MEPLKHSGKHDHQVWVSPTGKTAYGIIRFTMPFPVGPDLALWGFMREMRKSEGEANLLSKAREGDGMKFVAEGGLYKIRANLTLDGSNGWAVYAGTLRKDEVVPDELKLAEAARDHTRVILPQ